MKTILVISPHPDDEALGCGGTLFKHVQAGDSIHWLIMTAMDSRKYDQSQREKRESEIEQVTKLMGFSSVSKAGFNTTTLDQIANNKLIDAISPVILGVKPDILYLPFWGDIHSDHYHTFEAASACTKSFRYPFVKKIRVYEILSETNFAIRPDRQFSPNLWIDISACLDKKLSLLTIYQSELGQHPFPRSLEGVRAQALLHGSVAGCLAAEAFMSLKEVL